MEEPKISNNLARSHCFFLDKELLYPVAAAAENSIVVMISRKKQNGEQRRKKSKFVNQISEGN
jgi:hypothetical protein